MNNPTRIDVKVTFRLGINKQDYSINGTALIDDEGYFVTKFQEFTPVIKTLFGEGVKVNYKSMGPHGKLAKQIFTRRRTV